MLEFQTGPQQELSFHLFDQRVLQIWPGLVTLTAVGKQETKNKAFIIQMLTEVICDFVGAICIDPEKDSPCASDNTSTFVHSDSNEDSTGVHRLHVYVTWHPQVLPDNRKYIQLLTA